jgi:hypothetical protein
MTQEKKNKRTAWWNDKWQGYSSKNGRGYQNQRDELLAIIKTFMVENFHNKN